MTVAGVEGVNWRQIDEKKSTKFTLEKRGVARKVTVNAEIGI